MAVADLALIQDSFLTSLYIIATFDFGLKINSEKRTKKIEKKIYSTSNVIDFKKYKKLN